MLEEDFRSLLVRAFTKITGVDFYQAYTGFTIPSTQYGTINKIASTKIGIDSRKYERADPLGPNGEEVKEIVSSDRIYTISVNIYNGINNGDLCERLKASFMSTAAHWSMYEGAAIGFTEASIVRDLFETIDGVNKPRSQFDVTFNVSLDNVFYVEEIQHANIKTEFDNSNTEFTVTVDKP